MKNTKSASAPAQPQPSNPSPVDASGIPVHCSFDELVDITQLVKHPRNPNKHPEAQVALLARVIRAQGWRSPIVVSRRSGFMVAGHGRAEAAAVLQVEKVPVNFQNFATEAEEVAHVLADNRLAELSDTDDAALKAALDSLGELDGDISLAGFLDADIASLTASLADAPFVEVSEQRRARRCTCPKCGHKWYPAA